ncbi:hypothetical protein BpHYR1_006748 [Brachionus plicatilis]|uniref:Uncharacterized protein n=1 Tax=Brachionus plicatilis TaxID=10195 RepID=A0A3M7RKS2_BRAPC|nr:hypothetical protein BpHYR1_006748 [Brachionus plicatilis]
MSKVNAVSLNSAEYVFTFAWPMSTSILAQSRNPLDAASMRGVCPFSLVCSIKIASLHVSASFLTIFAC